MTSLTPVPPALTKPQLFRLVEIAHETKDEGIRKAALDLFAVETNPAYVVAAGPEAPDAKLLPVCGDCRHHSSAKWSSTFGHCSRSARGGENLGTMIACAAFERRGGA